MADLKEDWIDFGKLEKELDAAVEKDARYWRENDAKFRAVDQRVESYEQFRDIVKAAHIKPLDKKDKIGQGKRNQPWNPYTSKTADVESPNLEGPSREEPSCLPKTSHEFTRDWRSHCNSPTEKYRLLTSLGAERLGRLFRAEIAYGLLGDFLTVLNKQFQESDLHGIVGILGSLARANRFGLSVDFLSNAEKQEGVELFQKLQQASEFMEKSSAIVSNSGAEELPSESTVSVDTHQTLYAGCNTLKEELTSLRKVYNL